MELRLVFGLDLEADLIAAAVEMPQPATRLSAPALTLIVLAVAAVLLRAPQLGNPLLDVDEQFYLLVGDRMLHGVLPYVDIWDRKPIGLFLIFAAIRLLGGDGVVQYQLVAGLFALATAALVATIARRSVGPVAAAAGGIAYLVWLNLIGGSGGQSPVFYNLLTAVAALATLRALGESDPDRLRRHGQAAMLAMGLALQIKTTALFEGCLFGLTFLYLGWRGDRRPPAALALRLAAIAIAPTLLAFLAYAGLGHAQDWWFANVTSIFLRSTPPDVHPAAKLGGIVLALLPLAVAALWGLARRWREGGAEVRFVALWLAVAAAGFLAVPPYYNHYGLPLLLPLAIAAAPAFARGLVGVVAALLAAVMLALTGWPDFGRTIDGRAHLAALGGIVARHLDGGCLLVFEGPTALYQATHACTVSRYVFPNHLNYLGEAGSIGVDPAAEMARAIAARPAVIVVSRRTAIVDPNPATWDIVEAAVRRDYRPVGTGISEHHPVGIYARR